MLRGYRLKNTETGASSVPSPEALAKRSPTWRAGDLPEDLLVRARPLPAPSSPSVTALDRQLFAARRPPRVQLHPTTPSARRLALFSSRSLASCAMNRVVRAAACRAQLR